MEEKEFGDLIKALRLKAGMGSRELSSLVNKGSSYISQIENKRNKNPEYRIAHTLLKILGVNENEIEEILKQYDISPPEDNSHLINPEREIANLLNSLKNDIPNEVSFTKEMNLNEKDEIIQKINTMRELMILIIDFNPKKKATIEKYYKLFFTYALGAVSERVRELISDDDLDLKTMTSIGDQLKDELVKRGLSDLLNKEAKL